LNPGTKLGSPPPDIVDQGTGSEPRGNQDMTPHPDAAQHQDTMSHRHATRHRDTVPDLHAPKASLRVKLVFSQQPPISINVGAHAFAHLCNQLGVQRQPNRKSKSFREFG